MFWWLEHIWHIFFPKKEMMDPILTVVYYIDASHINSQTVVQLVEGFNKQMERWRLLQPNVTILDMVVASTESRVDIKYLSGSDQSDTETLKSLRSYLQSELTINNPVEFFQA